MKKIQTPEEGRIVGDFGEYAVAFFLTKEGINVIRCDTVLFDLIVKDKYKRIFDDDKIRGISVKLRDRSNTTASCTIQINDYEKVLDYGKKWNILPYFCHIIIYNNKEKGRVLQGFIFSYRDAKKYFSDKKQKYAVSFAKMRADINKFFIPKKNYFEWVL